MVALERGARLEQPSEGGEETRTTADERKKGENKLYKVRRGVAVVWVGKVERAERGAGGHQEEEVGAAVSVEEEEIVGGRSGPPRTTSLFESCALS